MSSPSVSSQLKAQWTNPKDILSVLLIVGADVIRTALTQFTFQSFKPVAFSFGWVAYAYTFLLSTASRFKTMPGPEFRSVLIDCQSSITYESSSWLLGRVLHHYDHWMPREARIAIQNCITEMNAFKEGGPYAQRPALAVTVFEASAQHAQGVPRFDAVTATGVFTSVFQLSVAAIPCGISREWEILLLTACGTILAWSTGFLQARTSNARRNSTQIHALTKGNGFQDVIVIYGNGVGLNLQDLASDVASGEANHAFTIAYAIITVALWTALLITTSALESGTWYLLAIGGIGMLPIIYSASARREPIPYGIHRTYKECIAMAKVMPTLIAVEERYPKVGKALLPIFFPGPLRPQERDWWAAHD